MTRIVLQSQKWQLIVMSYPLSTLANNWTRGAACRHTTPQSATEGLHPVAHKLRLIATNHGGMARLSWPAWLLPIFRESGCLSTHYPMSRDLTILHLFRPF